MKTKTPVLDALHRLPETALENVWKQQLPPAEIMVAPTIKHIFGHQVKLTPLEEQHMQLSRREQIITDWQEAKTKLYKMLEREGVTPKAIVPKNVFEQTLQTLRIIPLPGMTEQGKVFANPLVIDVTLSGFILAKIKEKDQWYVDRKSKIIMAHGNPEMMLSVWFESYRPNKELHTKIAGSEMTVLGKEISFVGDYNGFFDQIFPSYGNYSAEARLAEMEEAFLKNVASVSNPYGMYSCVMNRNMMKADSFKNWYPYYVNHEIFQGNIIFPELPDEFQRMLVTLKSKFPHWPVHTAADPDFFKINWQGYDVSDYAKQRIDLWTGVFQDLKQRIPEMKRMKEEFQQKFSDELAKLGMRQKSHHSIWSDDDLRRAIEKEKDPIFYVITRQEHKNISYDMAIIWGQTGESPRERQAIEQLQATDHSVFMGKQAN